VKRYKKRLETCIGLQSFLLLGSGSIAKKGLVEHLNGFDVSIMKRPSELTA
jgi:hypothetical protein